MPRKAEKLPVRLPEVPGIRIIDRNTVSAVVDGDVEIFKRTDRYGAMFGSGLAQFGPVMGDWRMISNIAEDVRYVFDRI